ncbi:EGF-like, alliinase [Corchorus capsularis]|uniref:EGF-like, alliinase n=1 Tax=Corchorus capsularis TaxID=210143 RepID=A0A1R3HSY2_COCAP|nr:EGF-like, alliinase [Corchorus capsularis]
MGKIDGSKYIVASITLNLILIINLCVSGKWKLSWSSQAAIEAETVAAISCSGHGRAFLDGLVLDGKQPICECNSCYQGSDCSNFIPGCAANVDGYVPFLLVQHAASSAVVVAGWHRMSYKFNDHTFISQELERLIRKVHDIVGNAVTDNRFIVFGAGSTQILSAAVYALSADNASSPARVLTSNPYYPLYKMQTELFASVNFEYQGDTSLWKNSSDAGTNMIEFVTSPNNPDGQLNKAVLHGPYAKAIYDRAYYWPHFTPIPAPADEDVMMFTLSKLTGHAGSRFGWAVIKDEAVFQRMTKHIGVTSIGVSRDGQLRALKLLKVVLEREGKEIFEFGYETMKTRWEKLVKALSLSKRFSLQDIEPQFCTFFQKLRQLSPAYAWLKCEREEEKDCYAVHKAANIIGHEGSVFGAEDRYIRLSMIGTQDEYDLLIDRLNKLVSEEVGAKTMRRMQPSCSLLKISKKNFTTCNIEILRQYYLPSYISISIS